MADIYLSPWVAPASVCDASPMLEVARSYGSYLCDPRVGNDDTSKAQGHSTNLDSSSVNLHVAPPRNHGEAWPVTTKAVECV